MPQSSTQSVRYDPANPQPYQPYTAPEPAPPPPTVAEQSPGFQFTGAPNTTLGNIAGALDNIFRGYMRGKQEGEIRKVMQMKAKTDNLQNSYNQDATLLFNMAQSGADPNSQEFKNAVSAVQGSWGALQDWIGTHVNGDDTKSKKKSKGGQAAQQQPQQFSMADLQSPDPNVRAKALYQMRQKMGPPVLWQVQQFNTPQAKAQRQAEQQGAQNVATETGIQTQQLTHEQLVTNAQTTLDQLGQIPESQRTPAQSQQYKQAYDTVYPVKPGGEADRLADQILHKAAADPKYQFTDQDKQILRAAGYGIDPKDSIQVTKTGEIVRKNSDGTIDILRPSQPSYESHGRGGGGPGEDKNYQKWRSYYREHYPDMPDQDVDAMARRKVEGSSAISAGEIAHNALTEPQQFDNDVISLAIDSLRKMPQYSGDTSKPGAMRNSDGNAINLDDALANIVGQGDYGYAYHSRAELKKNPDGSYSGRVTDDQLRQIERDLQNQMRAILSSSKVQGMSPQERRTVLNRMMPLFGPAAQGSGTPPASPQATPQSPPAPASSSAPGGGSKGTVKKSAFLKANQGATDADWNAIKPQLQKQGYETKDE